MTIPNETPMSWTAITSLVIRSTAGGSIPNPWFPASISPESFRRTRP
jgi:hypothetical protein